MNTPAKSPLRFRVLTLALAATALCACEPAAQAPAQPPLAGAAIGGEFALSNTEGKTVRWSDFQGQYRIVYFGYAFCPDMCPTDMQRTMQGLEEFAADAPQRADSVKPIFISVDPERDTPEVIAEFTAAFSDRLMGLTGSEEDLKSAAAAFGAYFTKLEPNETGSYLIDHSRAVYLFGPEGEPIALLPADEGADAVKAELEKWVN